MILGKCMYAWCNGKELTWFEELYPYFYFFGFPLFLAFVLIFIARWIYKK